MRLPAIFLPALLALYWPAAQALDPDGGQRLHDQRCVACHARQFGGDGSAIYLRPYRLINDRKALEQRVATCNKMTKAGLTPDEEKAVGAYLNQKFYKFDQ